MVGLKENVIIGKQIPAGTGMRRYRDVKLSTEFEETDELSFDEDDFDGEGFDADDFNSEDLFFDEMDDAEDSADDISEETSEEEPLVTE